MFDPGPNILYEKIISYQPRKDFPIFVCTHIENIIKEIKK
jgi:hypothetical protein